MSKQPWTLQCSAWHRVLLSRRAMDKIREYVKAQIKKRYPLYNVADELGTSMYTSDIRETVSINYDGLTRELTKQQSV